MLYWHVSAWVWPVWLLASRVSSSYILLVSYACLHVLKSWAERLTMHRSYRQPHRYIGNDLYALHYRAHAGRSLYQHSHVTAVLPSVAPKVQERINEQYWKTQCDQEVEHWWSGIAASEARSLHSVDGVGKSHEADTGRSMKLTEHSTTKTKRTSLLRATTQVPNENLPQSHCRSMPSRSLKTLQLPEIEQLDTPMSPYTGSR